MALKDSPGNVLTSFYLLFLPSSSPIPILLIRFLRVFRIVDNNQNKGLDLQEFKKGLQNYGLSVSSQVCVCVRVRACVCTCDVFSAALCCDLL